MSILLPVIDYKSILNDAFALLGLAMQKSEAAEIEIAKQKQFIVATMRMLSDEDKKHFDEMFNAAVARDANRSSGLKEAIRKLFPRWGGQWLTVAEVRDCLDNVGFDFSDYTTNPLASISTTLRRMVPDELETTMVETVTAYRPKEPTLAQKIKAKEAQRAITRPPQLEKKK
jgi:hypothetical protein